MVSGILAAWCVRLSLLGRAEQLSLFIETKDVHEVRGRVSC